MQRGRTGRIVAGIVAVATVTVGLGLSGAGAGESSDQFENLKPIKAPSPCKNDPGVSDTEIKIGTIIPDVRARSRSSTAGRSTASRPGSPRPTPRRSSATARSPS